jgi:hypothetical protein
MCNVFQLLGELDAAQISAKDLENKVSLLERSNVANRDTLLRGVQERQEKEIIGLRNQIESITEKLNAKVCCRATLRSDFLVNALPLNAKLNPVCHLLALLGVHHILNAFRIRVKLRLFSKSQKNISNIDNQLDATVMA